MGKISFREAKVSDVGDIMEIISQAQKYLKSLNIDQWQNNYPNNLVIENDIKNNNAYVAVINKKVVGFAAIIFDKELTYNTIYNGSWLSRKPYVTVHRIAVAKDYKNLGIGNLLIEKTVELAKKSGVSSIRIDTHQDNLIMQKFIFANNFTFCGHIYLGDKSLRLAYERLVE